MAYEFVKLASINDEMFYTWQRIPLFPKPITRTRKLLFEAIQNEKQPTRREVIETLNPELLKEVETFVKRIESEEGVLRPPSQKEI